MVPAVALLSIPGVGERRVLGQEPLYRLVEITEPRLDGRFVAALEALRQHRADTLVVSKLDRLSRSLVDFAGLMERASRENWALVALDLGVDTTTPTGEMVANVMATFAQFERRLIGQRTREALAEKRRAGTRLGRPPTISGEVASRIADQYAAGMTLRAIADGLTGDGIPTVQGGVRWYPSTVAGVLRRLGQAPRRRGPRPSCRGGSPSRH
jgi:hypothetical protein